MTTTLQNNIEEAKKRFIEKGADLEHIRWAKWQNYLHTFLVWNNNIQMWTLPHEKKEHWDEQIRTPYAMLTEHEKEMDRKEARTYLPLLEQELISIYTLAQEEARKEIIKNISKSEYFLANTYLNWGNKIDIDVKKDFQEGYNIIAKIVNQNEIKATEKGWEILKISNNTQL